MGLRIVPLEEACQRKLAVAGSPDQSSPLKDPPRKPSWTYFNRVAIAVLLAAVLSMRDDDARRSVGEWVHWMHSGSVPLHSPLLILSPGGSGETALRESLLSSGLAVSSKSSARDATLSWIHAVRYINDPRDSDLRLLCSGPQYTNFHVADFGVPSQCTSFGAPWSNCWTDHCIAVIVNELACAKRGSDKACATRFDRAVLLARHPLAAVGELVANAGPRCANAGAVEVLMTARWLFPGFDWSSVTTCEEAFGWMYVQYNKAVLPYVDAVHRVELSTPCDVVSTPGKAREGGPCSVDSPGMRKLPLEGDAAGSSWARFEGNPALLTELRAIGVRLGSL